MTDKPNRDEKGHFLPAHNIPGPGRESLYDPSMNDQARKLALLGLTDQEIADFFGVTETTLNNWKNENPAFFESINEGKLPADAEVAQSLYKRATGEHVEVEKVVKGADGSHETITVKQYVPGEVQAQRLWLMNRRSKSWRDKIDMDHSGSVTVNLPKNVDKI